MELPILSLLAFAACWTFASAHSVLTYPGWRGNNLRNTTEFPYGMQWMYPCGGMNLTTNRTNWPINGGAVGVQPGWFAGHATAFFYINLGLGTDPLNYSLPMVPIFQITGPSKEQYNGSFCLPRVPLPANVTVKAGDNATIQVVETAIHGAALFSCVDITFTEPEFVNEVNSSNCANTTNIGFNSVYATSSTSGAFAGAAMPSHVLVLLPLLATYVFALLS